MIGKARASRPVVESFVEQAFGERPDRELLNSLVDDGFIDCAGSTKVKGRAEFVDQCRELARYCVVTERSRAWGRRYVVSHVRIRRRQPRFTRRLTRQIWFWSVRQGVIVGRRVLEYPVAKARLSAWFGTFRLLRAAVIVDVLFVCGLCSKQGLEVLRLMAGSPGDTIPNSLLLDTFGWPLFFGVAVACYCVLRTSLAVNHPGLFKKRRMAFLWLPPVPVYLLGPAVLLAAAPSLAVGIALVLAARSVASPLIPESMWFYALIQLIVGVLAVVMGIALSKGGSRPVDGLRLRRYALAMLGVCLLYGLVMMLFAAANQHGAEVLAIRFTLLLCVLGAIAWVADLFHIPLLTIGAIWLLLCSLLGWDDHHTIATMPGETATAGVADFFPQWLTGRQQADPKARFPVVIVASEGGGIRAAVMTTIVLDELRVRFPTFPHHLFAVVGVSGGSLGAAAYAAAVYEPPPEPGLSLLGYLGASAHTAALFEPAKPLLAESAADAMGSKKLPDGVSGCASPIGLIAPPGTPEPVWQASLYPDMLSPTLSSLLGEDLLIRMVPRWLDRKDKLSSYDRSRALEEAWEENWLCATGRDLSRISFGAVRPTQTSDQPALILLTTSTDTGERMAVSHFTFPHPAQEGAAGTLRTLADEMSDKKMSDKDVSLATAAFMSARFPLISPPARLPGQGEPRRYVDGGYYENSGVSTVLDLVHAIRTKAAGKADILVIRIENGGVEEERATRQWVPLVDLRQPLDALYFSREAHGKRAVRELEDEIEASKSCTAKCVKITEAVFRLQPTKTPLPLGWFITSAARAEIARQVLAYGEFAKVQQALGVQGAKP